MLPYYSEILETLRTFHKANSDNEQVRIFNPKVYEWLYDVNCYLTITELEEKYGKTCIDVFNNFYYAVKASEQGYRFDSRRTLYALLKEYHPKLVRRYDIANHRDNVTIHVDNFNVDIIIKLINTTYNIYRDKFDRTVMFNDLDIADIRSRNRELIYKERIKIEKYPIEDNKCWVDLKSMRFKVDHEYYSLADFVRLIVTNRPKSITVIYNLIDVDQYNDPLEITQEEIDTVKRMEEEFLKQQKEIQELSEYVKHKRQSSTPVSAGVEDNMPFKRIEKGLIGKFLAKFFK